jgi:hypothetical protein
LIRFLVALISAAIVIVGATYLLVQQRAISLPTFLWPSLILLLLSTAIIFRRIYNSQQSQFVIVYLGTLVIKLVAYLGYAVALLVFDKDSGVENVIFFLVVYFVFTFLEIMFLYPKINQS